MRARECRLGGGPIHRGFRNAREVGKSAISRVRWLLGFQRQLSFNGSWTNCPKRFLEGLWCRRFRWRRCLALGGGHDLALFPAVERVAVLACLQIRVELGLLVVVILQDFEGRQEAKLLAHRFPSCVGGLLVDLLILLSRRAFRLALAGAV